MHMRYMPLAAPWRPMETGIGSGVIHIGGVFQVK